jgi:hypothetical protein
LEAVAIEISAEDMLGVVLRFPECVLLPRQPAMPVVQVEPIFFVLDGNRHIKVAVLVHVDESSVERVEPGGLRNMCRRGIALDGVLNLAWANKNNSRHQRNSKSEIAAAHRAILCEKAVP